MVEGVETIDQLNIVTQLGFEEYQGYFFSKPLCKDSFEKLLTL
jgi:EAL domain-containing protein (putative c-di-GMP-specific phosphodiesterase class I)